MPIDGVPACLGARSFFHGVQRVRKKQRSAGTGGWLDAKLGPGSLIL